MGTDDLKYAEAVGLIRTFEACLIKESTFSKLKDCENIEQFFSKLKGSSYEFFEFENLADFEQKLDEKFLDVVEEIKKVCLKKSLFNVLFLQNDCFNLQMILMANHHNFDWKRLIKKPNFLSVDLLSDCVVEKKFDLLPNYFKELAVGIFDRLVHKSDNFEIFKYYNKKVFEIKLKLTQLAKCLLDLVRFEIDFENLKIILKAINLNLDETCLKNGLISGGFVDENDLFKAFCGGILNLTRFFKLSLDLNFKDVLEKRESVDDLFYEKLNDFWFFNRSSPFGFVPVAAYLLDLKREHRILKQILTKIFFVVKG